MADQAGDDPASAGALAITERRLMSAFDANAYGPTCAALLSPARVPPLDAGHPDAAVRGQLAALTTEQLFPGRRVRDPDMAAACRAGLFWYHDCIDEAHTISQDIETPS